ncbi:hypothetical protein BOH72_16220 [Mycobacterium sp. WY10]|nr:hypothetical protein BOH72_16220 [Mycobacterium sp. WY10]
MITRFDIGAEYGEFTFAPAGFAGVTASLLCPSGPDMNRAISDVEALMVRSRCRRAGVPLR